MAGQSFLYGGDSGGGGGGSALLTNKRVLSSSSKPLDSFFISRSSPSFLGSRSMVSFEDRGRPFFQTFDQEDNGDDEYDDFFHQPEKKRRLKADQVQFLEKSFETENKLEPERKIQLAKDLGLQPRQIAIWFQNRRARWKTKQLEKDYDDLQDGYNKLKSNYENLLKEKEKLKSEVRGLSDKLLMQEKAKGNSSSSSTKSQSEPPQQEQDLDGLNNTHTNPAHVMDDNVVVHDSDSPQGVQSSLFDSHVFEQDQSDGSMDEEENIMGKIFRPAADGHMLAAKFENPEYTDLQPAAADSCYFGYPGDDHYQSFGFWSYRVDSGP